MIYDIFERFYLFSSFWKGFNYYKSINGGGIENKRENDVY